MTSDDRIIEEFVCAVVLVIYNVCKLVRMLGSFLVMSYRPPINPIINPNTVSSH